MISNFRRVLNVVFFLLGDFPAYEFYLPTFRNTSIFVGRVSRKNAYTIYEYVIECSETSADKIQMSGHHPQESIEQKIVFKGL